MTAQTSHTEPVRIHLMMEEYRTLREEVSRCITIQSQTLIAGGAILGGALALATRVGDVLPAIPFLVIIVFALWVIEQSRMMRAGNYLQVLEDRMNVEVGGEALRIVVGWENWLRSDPRSRFSSWHYQVQQYGIFTTLLLIEGLALAGAWRESVRQLQPNAGSLVCLQGVAALSVITVLCVGLSVFIASRAWKVVRHEVERPKTQIRDELDQYRRELQSLAPPPRQTQ